MARLILGTLAVIVPFGVLLLPLSPQARTASAEVAPDGLPAAGPQPPKDETGTHPEFKTAGVCARCHVVSVLEWGISKHVAEGTTCRDCHGPSKAHVANERNEVKPDALPRGEQIARSCQRCHEAGCPETFETVSCQKCHHAHALVDPARQPRTDDGPFAQVLGHWESYRRQMEKGNERVRQADWKGAKGAFLEALSVKPGDREAMARLALCKRRLDPVFPGSTLVGDAFDSATGLPRDVQVSGLDIPMVLIPAGEFDMGSDRQAASRPVHTVAVDAFYLGKYEVTQAQWRAVMGANPSVHQGQPFAETARLPVESVSWDDCQEFIKRLNQRVAGAGFRLPTEAEWEYACRAGIGDAAPGGSVSRFAWYRDNARRDSTGDENSQSPGAWSPRPVGTKQANAWGLHDMLGNVSEWCSSPYRPYPYRPGDSRQPVDAPGMRVLRGGGFVDSGEGLDPTLRHFDRPHRRYRWNGLRLARDVPRSP